jgi:hypothetical protein
VPLEMSTIDIEAPGADEAALKAAIQALVPISTTTISVGVNYIDTSLPAGYSEFRLSFRLKGAIDCGLSATFSQDGGTSWLSNYTGDYDAYRYQRLGYTNGTGGAGTGDDAFMNLTGGGDSGLYTYGELIIFPGSASIPAIAHGRFFGEIAAATSKKLYIGHWQCRLNTQRVNDLRITTLNNEDPEAPGTYDELTGIISLYGAPE